MRSASSPNLGFDDAGSQKRLRILTQNMFCHVLQNAVTKDLASTEQRMAGLVENVRRNMYDVVLLQEMFILRVGFLEFGRKALRYTRERLAELGLIYHTDPDQSSRMLGQNSGLYIFSRHPFVSVLEQTYGKHKEFICNKGFQRVSVDFGGKLVHFLNTHLDSREDLNTSKAQIDQLRAAMEHTIPHVDPVVVCGDFNICHTKAHDSPSYQHLVHRMNPLRDCMRECKVSTHRTRGGVLDHIFLNTEVLKVWHITLQDIRDENNQEISDHVGISCEFSVRDRQRTSIGRKMAVRSTKRKAATWGAHVDVGPGRSIIVPSVEAQVGARRDAPRPRTDTTTARKGSPSG